ncbi:hypothetical protein C8Q80DRAFT_244094 [Daedaleopsis nitida]|nr:hypothetical protein C8Q80DRAFT_244094 [Daedaleopsis nitida]
MCCERDRAKVGVHGPSRSTGVGKTDEIGDFERFSKACGSSPNCQRGLVGVRRCIPSMLHRVDDRESRYTADILALCADCGLCTSGNSLAGDGGRPRCRARAYAVRCDG